ncbi:anion permease [Methylobacterium oryzisoli]|uniref:anion permease n=1 Tax=Methylobacterium oryzisoli TaxID=3385502 RepID=UPI00389257B2
MIQASSSPSADRTPAKPAHRPALWRALLPLGVAVLIALSPAPAGLASYTWHYFAIFAAVIAGLVVEPLPGPAVALAGVVSVTVLAPWVLFSPADLAKPGFKAAEESLRWALSGFANPTVWLVFTAFMLGLGYEKTGLGRRIALLLVRALGRSTLRLGYAVTLADAILAPFTPSNTARSAGTVYPVVRNLPPLYGSLPNHPSARDVGGYIMWTTFAAGCITSSLFLTALAPNLLAVELIGKIAGVQITWAQWFFAAAPFALPLLLLLPLLTYVAYRPRITRSDEVPAWAAGELERMGPISRREVILAVLVLFAVLMWIFGGHSVEATTAALIVLVLMLMTRVVTWEDMAANKAAWTTLSLLALLVTLAGGLSRTGFVRWFADYVATHMGGLAPTPALLALVAIYFFSHYMFASITAHTTAMLPVMLSVGMAVPGLPVPTLAVALAVTHGIMGVITPYATGPAPVYYESGYLPTADFWRLGTLFGLLFLGALLGIGVPLLMLR